MKIISISPTYIDNPKKMNSFMTILSYLDYKVYDLRNKTPQQVDINRFKGYDVMFIPPYPHLLNFGLIKYLRQNTGLIMVGPISQTLENYIYDQNIFFKTLYPYLDLYDGIMSHSEKEASMFRHIFGKPAELIGHCVDLEHNELLNKGKREDAIVSCARFHWNNAYANVCVARHFRDRLRFYDFMSANCTQKDREDMRKYYQILGVQPEYLPKTKWENMIKQLSNFKVAINMENRHNGSKFIIDCALAGVPCVCSNMLGSSRLFPDLQIDAFDIDGAIQKTQLLLDNNDFYNLIIKKAQEKLKFFDSKQGAKRFINLIEKIKRNKK